jgi:hypothetical protein
MTRQHWRIVGLRIGLGTAAVLVLVLLGYLMRWLPWQADCLLAAVVVLAYASYFERDQAAP